MITSNLSLTSLKQEPLCPVFGQCGGCAYQDIEYSKELEIKTEYLNKLFLEHFLIPLNTIDPIVPSPNAYHYRNRLDLKLMRQKSGEIHIGFSPQNRFYVVPVDQCPIAREEISNFLPQLKQEAIKTLPAKYRLANLVVRSGDEKKVLWGGIGRRSLSLDDQDFFFTEINGKKIFYSLDTFFQANLSILPSLMEKIHELNVFSPLTVFFDLYGGVGLFSLALEHLVFKVILIEESPTSLRLAWFNKGYHELKKLQIFEGKVEDILPDFLKQGSLLSHPSVALLDPPRSGLDAKAVTFLKDTTCFDSILYLSCQPLTLIRDLAEFIKSGWAIKRVIPFDFFPRTKHLEVLTLLKRN